MNSIKKSILPVTGLSCSNCALRISNAVGKLDGVIESNVDFASEKLAVSFDPDLLSEKDIILSVQKAGYGVATGKIELPVTGLQDTNDSSLLEKLLRKQDGILEARVNYGTERAYAEFIPGMCGVSEIVSIIHKAGFEIVMEDIASMKVDTETQIRSDLLLKQKHLLIIGLTFSIPLVMYSMVRDFLPVYLVYDRYFMLLAASIVQFITDGNFIRVLLKVCGMAVLIWMF